MDSRLLEQRAKQPSGRPDGEQLRPGGECRNRRGSQRQASVEILWCGLRQEKINNMYGTFKCPGHRGEEERTMSDGVRSATVRSVGMPGQEGRAEVKAQGRIGGMGTSAVSTKPGY